MFSLINLWKSMDREHDMILKSFGGKNLKQKKCTILYAKKFLTRNYSLSVLTLSLFQVKSLLTLHGETYVC